MRQFKAWRMVSYQLLFLHIKRCSRHTIRKKMHEILSFRKLFCRDPSGMFTGCPLPGIMLQYNLPKCVQDFNLYARRGIGMAGNAQHLCKWIGLRFGFKTRNQGYVSRADRCAFLLCGAVAFHKGCSTVDFERPDVLLHDRTVRGNEDDGRESQRVELVNNSAGASVQPTDHRETSGSAAVILKGFSLCQGTIGFQPYDNEVAGVAAKVLVDLFHCRSSRTARAAPVGVKLDHDIFAVIQ